MIGTVAVGSDMDLSAPHLAVLPEATGSVLSVLAGTRRPLSGREVARLSGGARSTVARLLQRLAEHGLVRVQEAGAGAAFLYTLNREHVAAEPVVALVSLRRHLVDRLTSELAEWSVPPVHASLFGSAARGDGGTASDVDLLVVRPDAIQEGDARWRAQLDRLAELVVRWAGNAAGIAEVSVQELMRLQEERPPVFEEIDRDSITLHGPHVRELDRRSRR